MKTNNSATTIRLRYGFILIIIAVIWGMLSTLTSCDSEKADPFIGSWKFDLAQPSVVATFTIKRSGNSYVIESANINGTTCDNNHVKDAKLEKFIEVITILNNASIEGTSYLNLTPSDDGKTIHVDTVAYAKGSNNTTLHFNQVIIKQ